MTKKIRYVAYGVCPSCGKQIIRPYDCTIGVCTCSSAVEVPLKPALLLPIKSMLFQKINLIFTEFDIPREKLVSEALGLAFADKAIMKEAVENLKGESKKT